MADLPVILVLGVDDIELKSYGPTPPFETNELDCRCYPNDDNLDCALAKERPVVVVSIGPSRGAFTNLLNAPEYIKRVWLHFPDTSDLDEIGRQVFECYVLASTSPCESPLVSVITPTYNTGDKIYRPYHSLLAQTYKDWEWVIIDDSEDDGKTFEVLSGLAEKDSRIRVYRESRHSGVIGHVKRTGFDLGRGSILVELDHDDRLTPDCLGWLVKGFDNHPEVGFIYTDFAEVFENGGSLEYGPGWGMGYGSYRKEVHNGLEYSVVNCPHINSKTIRHIIAAPNHVRAWRTEVYRGIGGHNPKVHVADDFEVMVRTFLSTRMGHLPKMGYVQYRNQDGNTQTTRNKDIQRLVRYFSILYDEPIHDRLVELGVDDFLWDEERKEPSFFRLFTMGNPPVESHCTITIEV